MTKKRSIENVPPVYHTTVPTVVQGLSGQVYGGLAGYGSLLISAVDGKPKTLLETPKHTQPANDPQSITPEGLGGINWSSANTLDLGAWKQQLSDAHQAPVYVFSFPSGPHDFVSWMEKLKDESVSDGTSVFIWYPGKAALSPDRLWTPLFVDYYGDRFVASLPDIVGSYSPDGAPKGVNKDGVLYALGGPVPAAAMPHYMAFLDDIPEDAEVFTSPDAPPWLRHKLAVVYAALKYRDEAPSSDFIPVAYDFGPVEVAGTWVTAVVTGLVKKPWPEAVDPYEPSENPLTTVPRALMDNARFRNFYAISRSYTPKEGDGYCEACDERICSHQLTSNLRSSPFVVGVDPTSGKSGQKELARALERERTRASLYALYGLAAVPNLWEMARTFYGALACADPSNPNHKTTLDNIVRRTADEFVKITLMNCACEYRHCAEDITIISKDYYMGNRVMPMLDKYGAYRSFEFGENRADGAAKFYHSIVAEYGPVRALRLLRNTFTWQAVHKKHSYGSDYGGAKWAAAPRLALMYVRGEIGPMEYVDRAINLVHNGGVMWNKVVYCDALLPMWLSCKDVADDAWLQRWAPNSVRKAFGLDEVVALPLRPEFLRRELPEATERRPYWPYTQMEETGPSGRPDIDFDFLIEVLENSQDEETSREAVAMFGVGERGRKVMAAYRAWSDAGRQYPIPTGDFPLILKYRAGADGRIRSWEVDDDAVEKCGNCGNAEDECVCCPYCGEHVFCVHWCNYCEEYNLVEHYHCSDCEAYLAEDCICNEEDEDDDDNSGE